MRIERNNGAATHSFLYIASKAVVDFFIKLIFYMCGVGKLLVSWSFNERKLKLQLSISNAAWLFPPNVYKSFSLHHTF